MVLGSAVAADNYFGMYRLIKEISIGRFFQRGEVIFEMFWILVELLYISIGFYGATIISSKIFKIKKYKTIIPIYAIIIYEISLLPHDFGQVMYWNNEVLRKYSALVTFLIPLLLLIISKIRFKKNQLKVMKNKF